MNYEEFMKYVDKMDNNIRKKLKDNEEELTFYSQLVISFNETCNKNQKQKEVIDKTIEIIEPLTEFDMCTINGKILRKPLEILKEVSE